ncbi:MAG: GtrA family protein [Selenomonadaceae bacterium]|nr:GtrA family protein [Selenomonadaceae bacterium]
MKSLSVQELKRAFLSRKFLLFLVIGCINTFDCSLFATMLTPVTGSVNVSFNIGYVMSNIIAYFLNAYFVFPSPLSLSGWVKFFLSYIPNYLVQNVLVVVMYNYMDIPPIVSFMLSAVLGIPVTFLLVKMFAFGDREN